MSQNIDDARTQLRGVDGARNGDPGAMQRMRVESLPTTEAVRVLQIEILHLRNALELALSAIEDLERRRR